jgi:hypothetical protein
LQLTKSIATFTTTSKLSGSISYKVPFGLNFVALLWSSDWSFYASSKIPPSLNNDFWLTILILESLEVSKTSNWRVSGIHLADKISFALRKLPRYCISGLRWIGCMLSLWIKTWISLSKIRAKTGS